MAGMMTDHLTEIAVGVAGLVLASLGASRRHIPSVVGVGFERVTQWIEDYRADPVADVHRYNAALYATGMSVGADSAVYLRWRAGTDGGGACSVLGEWAGALPPCATTYRGTEMYDVYVADVIDPMSATLDCCRLLTSDLTEGSALRDQYDRDGIVESYVLRVSDFERGGRRDITYVSVRFTVTPPEPEAVRTALRSLVQEL